jgi:hypothetical protein
MAHDHRPRTPRRHLGAAAMLFAVVLAPAALFPAALAQPNPASHPPPAHFIEIIPTEGRAPVHLATSQVVRLGRVENFTTIDTAAWVQQRTTEPVEAIARRLRDAGQRLVALTDLNHGRVFWRSTGSSWSASLTNGTPPAPRAAIVMVGLRFNTDVAVRETAPDVMAAIRREGQAAAPEPRPDAHAGR